MLVSLVFDCIVISWIWLTIRLKTKKHTLIRVALSFVFTVLNFFAVISIAQEDSMKKEDTTIFIALLVFYLVLLLLWGLRLVSDLIFFSRKHFEDKEVELSEKISEKFNLKTKEKENKNFTKQTTNDFIPIKKTNAQRKLTQNKNLASDLLKRCGFKIFINYYAQIKHLPLCAVNITKSYTSEEKEERLIAAKKIINLNLTEYALKDILKNYDLNPDEQEKVKTLLNNI